MTDTKKALLFGGALGGVAFALALALMLFSAPPVRASAESEDAAESALAPGCFVAADAAEVAALIREDGGRSAILPNLAHTWEHRPPAFKRDDFATKGVRVKVADYTPHHGVALIRTHIIKTQAQYERAYNALETAVGYALPVDTQFGMSPDTDNNQGDPLRGYRFTGSAWKHVLASVEGRRPARTLVSAPICWQYYGPGLPAPTPEPAPAAAPPATEGE